MLQDARAIRYYQKLTDTLVELRRQGYSLDELRLYLDGYVAALRHGSELEPWLVHRLEEDAVRFLYDPANFDLTGVP
ncbi:MAG: hypothetical protein Q6L50_03995 [Gloeomargarita sp. GMQP_bins_120]